MGISKIIAKGLVRAAQKALPAERKVISKGKNIFSSAAKEAKSAEKTVKEAVLPKADNAAAEAATPAGHSVFEATQTAPDMGFSAAAKRLNAVHELNPKPAEKVTGAATPAIKPQETLVKPSLTPEQAKELADFPPVENYLKNLKTFETLSDETKLSVNLLGEKIMKSAKLKKNSYAYKYLMSRVRELLTFCDDEKAIKMIVSDEVLASRYFNNKAKVLTLLGNKYRTQGLDGIRLKEKLSVMSVLNPEGFKALRESKGMEEIIAGRLNFSYLNDVNVFDKIDGDFFYKMFDKLEKANIERLKKAGIDSDLVMKYLKLPENDKMVCLDTHFADNVITSLEKVNDPELVNKILKTCKFDNYWTKFDDNCFKTLIQNAIKEPKTVSKVMRLEKNNPYSAADLVELMKDKSKFKISDELFEKYLKFEKAHPDCCYPSTLRYLNEFISKGGDEKLAQKIFENAEKFKSNIDVTDILHGFNKENRELLNKCLEKGSIIGEEAFKFKFLADNGAVLKDEEISKLFKDTYTPLMKELSSKSGGEIFVKMLSNLKAKSPAVYQKLMDINITELIKDPEFAPSMLERYIHALDNPSVYKRLTDTRLFDLIKDKKVNPRIILQMEQGELRPEILEDIQKLLKGESLVKKFTSTKDVLKNTSSGEVASVNGKMYINNNGKLDPWKMTEEKFNELFPLVDRFSVRQNIGDCYLISTLDALYSNPHTRGEYYKMFVQNGKAVDVTIPAYKDFLGTTCFRNGTFKPTVYSADGPMHLQMLERSYSRRAVRNPAQMEEAAALAPINPRTTTNNRFLYSRITGGYQETVMNEVIPVKSDGHILSQLPLAKDEAGDWVKVFSNDSDYIMTYSYWTDTARKSGHAITVTGYDEATQSVILRNPWHTAVEYKVPLDEFLNKDKFKGLSIFHVG